MVRTERCIIFREGRKNQNFHKEEILKSRGSNDRCRESFKLHNHEMGQVCGFQFKTVDAKVSEFDDTLKKAELLNHDNCMWLSSGGTSFPYSCYQYDGLFGWMDLKIDAWLISLLSTASPRPGAVSSTQVTFFDGSKVNPMEEASLVLDQRNVLNEDERVQEKLEEVVSWLVTATENESPDNLSATCFEGETESSPSRCSIWTSKKRSELELDVASSIDYRFFAITDSSDESSLCSSSFNSDYSSEVMDLEEYSTDKPLVWPTNWASEWGSETKWDLFIMSPRKDLHKAGNSPKDTSRVFSPRVPNRKSDLENSCTKRHLFGTHSNSRDCLDLKNTNGINDGKKMKSYPSRRKKSTKTSPKIVPFPSVDAFETLTQGKDAYESESKTYTRSSSATSVCKSLQLSTSSIYSVSDITDGHMLLSSSSSYDYASDVEVFEDTRTKTPVFWPSICAAGWDSDTKWDSFVMSPQKDICITGKPPNTSPNSLRLQVVKGNMDVEKGCSRKLEFSHDSKSLTNMTSCTKTVATVQAEAEPVTKISVTKDKIVLEDLLLVDRLIVEGFIEQVLGLGEFDGHEGIESEFNKDEFCLV